MSGPLLDRIDLRVMMPRVAPDQLIGSPRPETSARVRERVAAAWARALERNAGMPNGRLRGQRLVRACALDGASRATLRDLAEGLALTARSVHRVMRVARTVADLRGLERVGSAEILAAASIRDPALECEAAA